MNRVGFFRTLRTVAAKDLRLEWRTWETLSQTTVFSLTVLVILTTVSISTLVNVFRLVRCRQIAELVLHCRR